MIVGLGLDMVEIDRIRDAYARFGERFLARILCDAERERLPADPVLYLAARFAAKEAAVKALGTGFTMGIGFHDLTIGRDRRGKPDLSFSGKALERARVLDVSETHISLTHSRDAAAAVVVLERR
jgi:holo-[acyl-carrier protein] synthase